MPNRMPLLLSMLLSLAAMGNADAAGEPAIEEVVLGPVEMTVPAAWHAYPRGTHPHGEVRLEIDVPRMESSAFTSKSSTVIPVTLGFVDVAHQFREGFVDQARTPGGKPIESMGGISYYQDERGNMSVSVKKDDSKVIVADCFQALDKPGPGRSCHVSRSVWTNRYPADSAGLVPFRLDYDVPADDVPRVATIDARIVAELTATVASWGTAPMRRPDPAGYPQTATPVKGFGAAGLRNLFWATACDRPTSAEVTRVCLAERLVFDRKTPITCKADRTRSTDDMIKASATVSAYTFGSDTLPDDVTVTHGPSRFHVHGTMETKRFPATVSDEGVTYRDESLDALCTVRDAHGGDWMVIGFQGGSLGYLDASLVSRDHP